MSLFKYFKPASCSTANTNDGNEPSTSTSNVEPVKSSTNIRGPSQVNQDEDGKSKSRPGGKPTSASCASSKSVVSASGKKRSASTESETIVSSKVKRTQTFKDSWVTGRPWLSYVNGLGMFCKMCQKYDMRPYDRDTWNKTPCTRLRKESVYDHEKSVAHKDALKRDLEAKQNAKVYDVPEVSLSHISQVFATLYFLCKQRIPHTTTFEPLLNFLDFLGMNLQSSVKVGSKTTYTSRKSVQEMLYCMSDIIESDVMTQLKDSSHFSLMFDETTDCSVKEQMVIRSRFLDSKGSVHVRYMKIIECLKTKEQDNILISLNAKNIANHVVSYIEQNELDFARLRGLGTDGAAVMTGRLNGAVKRIQEHQMQKQGDTQMKCEAVGLHCAAHKLNLAASQAGDKVKYVKKFKDLIRQLFDFYQNSAVRSAGLESVQRLLGVDSKKMIESSTTRWLSLGNATLRLKEVLPSVIISLGHESEERGDATATGLCIMITQYQFIATLLMMCDILPTVNRLSKIFQTSTVDFALVTDMVQTTINKLQTRRQEDGECLQDIHKYISEIETTTGVSVKFQTGLRQDVGSKEAAKDKFAKEIKFPYLDTLISNIRDRFTDSDVLSAFSIFDPTKLNMVTPDYGNDKVEALVQRFGSYSKSEARQEWSDFKQYLNDHLSKTNVKCKDVIHELATNDTLKTVYPIMGFIAAVSLVLPPSTADCERDFSQMKIIKTTLRNRLTEESLDAIMRIVIEGPDLPLFPFDKAVQHWAQKKNRRLKP